MMGKTRAPALKVGKMTCPDCAAVVPSHVKACRQCGHRFSEDQLAAQSAFEAKIKRWTPAAAIVLLVGIASVTTCAIRDANAPLTPAETAEKAASDLAGQKFQARATAAAAVQMQLKNPPSFDLVDAQAMPGKTDDGEPGWIVGVTYRATNGFGGVVTGNSIVSVDQTGKIPLKIVDADHPPEHHRHHRK